MKTVVAQAVEGEAGVHLQRTSPTMAGIFVRGLTGNKVNVFVDGVRYSNGAQRGGVNTFLDLIEPDALEGDRGRCAVRRARSTAATRSAAASSSSRAPPALGMPDGLALAHRPERRPQARRIDTAAARAFVGYIGPSARRDRRRSSGRKAGGDPAGRRHRFARGGHALPRPPSDVLMDERLPDTGFHQFGGACASNWVPTPNTSIVASYMRTAQDGGKRYDQLLGGDGNLIAELNDLSLDLFSVRFERLGVGSFDARLVHLFVQQPARGAREPGRQRQPDGDDRPRAGAHDGPRRAGVAHAEQLSPRRR